MPAPFHPSCSILRMKQLAEKLSVSKSTIWSRLNPRSKYHDPTFPKPIRHGNTTGFIEAEVEAWIASKMRERLAGEATQQ